MNIIMKQDLSKPEREIKWVIKTGVRSEADFTSWRKKSKIGEQAR